MSQDTHPSDWKEALPDNVVAEVRDLWRVSHLGKDKHFSAAERKARYHTLVGFPVVLMNVLLGSAFLPALAEKPFFDLFVGDGALGVPLLAFSAALLGAVQTFFNFHKATEGHRSVANRYLYISKESQALVSGSTDGLVGREKLWGDFNSLRDLYHQTNTDAEAFQTSSGDFRKATSKLKHLDRNEGASTSSSRGLD